MIILLFLIVEIVIVTNTMQISVCRERQKFQLMQWRENIYKHFTWEFTLTHSILIEIFWIFLNRIGFMFRNYFYDFVLIFYSLNALITWIWIFVGLYLVTSYWTGWVLCRFRPKAANKLLLLVPPPAVKTGWSMRLLVQTPPSVYVTYQ